MRLALALLLTATTAFAQNDEPYTAEIRRHTTGPRFYRVSSRMLNDGNKGGGNIQLHKGNKSNTIDPYYYTLREWQMCGDLWPSP